MIIDIHAHMAFSQIYPSSYLTGMLEMENSGLDRSKLASFIAFLLKDNSCDKLIAQMDTAQIDKAVLLIIDGGIGLEEPDLSLQNIFKLHHKVLKKHPDRFLVFAGIDPRRDKKGLELFKRSVSHYGFKGLKLYPPMGYAMDDKRLYDYYRICDDNNLAVLIHTGPSLATLQNEFADPKYIFKVAADFPNVNFILAHAGYNLFNPSVKNALTLPNIYLDIAGFQSVYKGVNDVMADNLGGIFSEGINHKVIFGTDWPLFNTFSPLATTVSMVVELYNRIKTKDSAALENVLYRNAIRALRI